ncbi:MAG: hypothetical protein P8M50_06835 [Paracoccaceae bacterium]|nr:hypothetical protein [Paracoccaceae bacterium]
MIYWQVLEIALIEEIIGDLDQTGLSASFNDKQIIVWFKPILQMFGRIEM